MIDVYVLLLCYYVRFYERPSIFNHYLTVITGETITEKAQTALNTSDEAISYEADKVHSPPPMTP